jgi:hypothetical protein
LLASGGPLLELPLLLLLELLPASSPGLPLL